MLVVEVEDHILQTILLLLHILNLLEVLVEVVMVDNNSLLVHLLIVFQMLMVVPLLLIQAVEVEVVL
jgi:hypothetical protein